MPTPGPIDRAIRTYLDHLSIEKGLAANTLSSYRRDLRRYREFLDEKAIGDLDAITEATVTDFLVRLRECTRPSAPRRQRGPWSPFAASTSSRWPTEWPLSTRPQP